MSTSRKILYNTTTQVGGKLLVALLSIYALRLSTSYLGATAYGYLTIITAFITLFGTLTDWGLTTIAGREIARSPEQSEHIIGANLTVRTLISLVVTPLVILLGLLIYHGGTQELKIGLAIYSITLVVSTVQTTIAAIFIARMRNDIPALIEVISKVISIAGILLVIRYGLGYYGYVWMMIILSVITTLITIVVVKPYLRLRLNFSVATWKHFLLLSLPLGIVQIINMIYFNVDSLLLSFMRSAAVVGYYGVAYNVISYIMLIPSMFMTASMPALATADPEGLKRMIQKAFDALTILGVPCLVGGILLAKDIILAVSNAHFLPAVPAFALLMIGAGTSFISAVFGNALLATNHQNKLVRLGLIVMVTNIILNLILIPRYSLSGAAAAASATEVFAMFYVARLFARSTDIRPRLYQVWKSGLAGVAMVLAYFLLIRVGFLAQTGWSQLLLLTFILSLIYGMVLTTIKGLSISLIVDLVRGKE